jgi:predicted porin
MFRTTVALLCCLTAVAAVAQESTQLPVVLHGFGEWAYVRTDGNEYLDGNEDGDYDTLGLGLNVSTAIGDRLTVMGQLAMRSGEEDHPAAELDYAFAQWRFSDTLQIRGGRSKHPFGIYTEIFDVGTLRPFFHLPQSIYGPSEIAAQAYNGIGLLGSRQTGGSTSIDYDLYAGEITFDPSQRIETASEAEQFRDVIGGRIRFHTPIDGLSIGASAYRGLTENEEGEEGEEGEELEDHVEGGDRSTDGIGLHAEYAMLPLTLRAEVGRHKEEAEAVTTAYYLEAAYRLGQHLELAGRWDAFDAEHEEAGAPDVEHRDLGLGLNYWFNPNLVVKMSVHRVKGFGVATPAGDDADDDDTTAFVFGTQFSF